MNGARGAGLRRDLGAAERGSGHRQVRARGSGGGKAGLGSPGTGRAGPDLRAPAPAGRLLRSRAAPPARLASCPVSRPSLSLRPRRVLPPPPAFPHRIPEEAAAGTMGTPASVVSDPPGRAAPAVRGRKRASANIFQGVGLPELRSLFRSGGADRPEERARLVWRYAGQRRMARALRRLRRRRPAQPGGGMAALRRFGRLRIAEEEPEGGRGAEAAAGSRQQR
ncbi:arginine vasopressin-induced protein 1 [Rhynochetos jubatus]